MTYTCLQTLHSTWRNHQTNNSTTKFHHERAVWSGHPLITHTIEEHSTLPQGWWLTGIVPSGTYERSWVDPRCAGNWNWPYANERELGSANSLSGWIWYSDSNEKLTQKKLKLVLSSHDETMKMVCKWNSSWPYANELDLGGAKQLVRLGLQLCFKRKINKICTLFKWRDYKRMWFNDQEKPSRFLNKR